MRRKLHYVRRERGLTQDDLADFADISPVEVSKIEFCESDGTEPIWNKLATILHVDAEILKEEQNV